MRSTGRTLSSDDFALRRLRLDLGAGSRFTLSGTLLLQFVEFVDLGWQRSAAVAFRRTAVRRPSNDEDGIARLDVALRAEDESRID